MMRPQGPAAAAAQVAAFGYHEVTEEPLTSGFVRRGAVRYTLTPRAFATHLDRMAEQSRSAQLVTEIDLARPARHLLLTFDDGGRSAMHAAAELERRGWRGHFFVITARLGERTFLSAGDVRELHAHGHLVGSHSHTHPDIFRELAPARIADEWRESVDRLAQLLGTSCVAAAVPGGHTSSVVERAAGEVGVRYVFTCTPTTRPQRVDDFWVLGRVLVRRTTRPSAIAALAGFRGWERAFLVRRGKDAMRSGVPWLFRAWVRRMTRELAPTT
jgi:peptidoglycan/xylan/chitin deacetylase (PgdA/CDA1 family)